MCQNFLDLWTVTLASEGWNKCTLQLSLVNAGLWNSLQLEFGWSCVLGDIVLRMALKMEDGQDYDDSIQILGAAESSL